MERIIVKSHIFKRFMKACKEARKPNKALLDAAAFTIKRLPSNPITNK